MTAYDTAVNILGRRASPSENLAELTGGVSRHRGTLNLTGKFVQFFSISADVTFGFL
jgi:hypothetical protein